MLAEPAAPIPVRLAGVADEQELIAMVLEMHPDAALRAPDGTPFQLDEEMVRGELHRAVVPNRNSNDLPAWVGVVGEPGRLTGSIYLSIENTWYSRVPVLVERWLFVRPQNRRSNIAASLIEFAKRSADAARTTLVVGHMSTGREEAKSRFYRRHLKPLGGYYVHYGRDTSETGAV